jgi:hypothetical protein
MTECPKCGGRCEQTDKMIPGHLVRRCRACNVFNVAGSEWWPTGGDGLMPQLLGHAMKVEEEDALYREAKTWKPGDPKWTLLELFR